MQTVQKKKDPPKILIVDDISINVEILENIVQAEGYEPLCALNVQEALDIMKENMPQLILSDLSMPGMDGVEFCRLLKNNPRTRDIPFIFITVADSSEEKKAAFSAGAADFIPKPIEPVEVIMRVNNQLNSYRIKREMENYNRLMHSMVAEQKRQMEKEQEHVLLTLSRVAERRGSSVPGHLERVGRNCRVLAQSLQLMPKFERLVTDEFIETIGTAARLHDIGNLAAGIRDEGGICTQDVSRGGSEICAQNASQDKNALPPEAGKRTEVRLRAEEGARLLEEIRGDSTSSRFLNMAILIARYHHACWDGNGYPDGVRGEDIPLAARITAVTNDFDMLICQGTHSPGEAAKVICQGGGTAYDPNIVDVFAKIQRQIQIPSTYSQKT